MNRLIRLLSILLFSLGVEAKEEIKWSYVEVQTGDSVVIDPKSSTYTIDKNIERANYCKESSEFICFITERYKFIFPKQYSGQSSWHWKNYTFCVANNSQSSLEKRKKLLVYIWNGAKCGENYAGAYLYSLHDGLQYITTKIGLPVGQLDLLSTDNKGFGCVLR